MKVIIGYFSFVLLAKLYRAGYELSVTSFSLLGLIMKSVLNKGSGCFLGNGYSNECDSIKIDFYGPIPKFRRNNDTPIIISLIVIHPNPFFAVRKPAFSSGMDRWTYWQDFPDCKTFLGQLLAYGVPQLCLIDDGSGDGLCDLHCTCIHNANFGKCINFPTNNPKIYVPQPPPKKMCTCDYINKRPPYMQRVITRETCLLLEDIPVYPLLFSSLLCSVFCSKDCICSHGFQSGSCEGPFCICNGSGPLNTN